MSTTGFSLEQQEYFAEQLQNTYYSTPESIRRNRYVTIKWYLESFQVYSYGDLLTIAKDDGDMYSFYRAEEIFENRPQ